MDLFFISSLSLSLTGEVGQKSCVDRARVKRLRVRALADSPVCSEPLRGSCLSDGQTMSNVRVLG